MNERFRRRMRGSLLVSVGWLFADMLLAIAILFLAANTFAPERPRVTPTATKTTMPTPTPTPKPTVLLRLELYFHRFQITVDPDGLLNGTPKAINDVKTQVMAQHFLKGRDVGLMIVYGGAPGDSDITSAENVANKVYGILLDLGKKGSIFARASPYDTLYVLGASRTLVTIDIFLFAQ